MATAEKCPICELEVDHGPCLGSQDLYYYICKHCGKYGIQHGLIRYIDIESGQNDKTRPKLKHWMQKQRSRRQHFEASGDPVSTLLDSREMLESILAQPLPNPAEQINNFILWIGNTTDYFGENITVTEHDAISIIGSCSPEEFRAVLKHLKTEAKYIRVIPVVGTVSSNHNKCDVTLTFEGWEYYEQIKHTAVNSRKAFMAMEYNSKEIEKLFENVLIDAVDKTGFDLRRLIDSPQPAGLIDDRLRVEIQTSRFLIADLTDENRGAYWEAGYAEGLGKPVIYICEEEKFKRLQTHFDTNHHLTVKWKLEDPNDTFVKELQATIRATLPGEAKMPDEEVSTK